MMMSKPAQNIIETIICTHFESIKVCAFILASFKNASDCIKIDIPLNEMIPDVKIKDAGYAKADNVFAPLVTSTMP